MNALTFGALTQNNGEIHEKNTTKYHSIKISRLVIFIFYDDKTSKCLQANSSISFALPA